MKNERLIEEYLSWSLDKDSGLFRGHSDSKFELKPAIGRVGVMDHAEIYFLERQMLTEFKRLARVEVSNIETDWEWMFLAQHHGLPTRLLDWTSNPLVALFFAARGNGDNDFSVHALTANYLVLEKFDTPPLELEYVHTVIPPLIHPRISQQSAIFTIHPEPTKNYEDQNKLGISKFVFKGSNRALIRDNLKTLGISEFSMFPGLDSLALSIAERIIGTH